MTAAGSPAEIVNDAANGRTYAAGLSPGFNDLISSAIPRTSAGRSARAGQEIYP